MIDARTLKTLPTRLTTRMIIEGALERGWQVHLYGTNSPQMRIKRPDGAMLEVYSSIPPTTSLAAARLSDDKYMTHTVLQAVGLPVLPTYQIDTDAQAIAAAKTILGQDQTFVVKPLDASHGNGVSVNLQTEEDLIVALGLARSFSPITIIQTYQSSAVDLRVLCVDNVFVAALERIPARVKADGQRTIEQLIIAENQSTSRGAEYTNELTTIPIDRVHAYLGEAIHAVPPKGTWVQLLGTANVGTGGETRDVTDELPEWLKKQAEQASKALNLAVCGVDFLASKAPAQTDTPAQLVATITEVNKGPSLFIHERPNHGSAQPAIAAFLDYLAKL